MRPRCSRLLPLLLLLICSCAHEHPVLRAWRDDLRPLLHADERARLERVDLRGTDGADGQQLASNLVWTVSDARLPATEEALAVARIYAQPPFGLRRIGYFWHPPEREWLRA